MNNLQIRVNVHYLCCSDVTVIGYRERWFGSDIYIQLDIPNNPKRLPVGKIA